MVTAANDVDMTDVELSTTLAASYTDVYRRSYRATTRNLSNR
jgi:hypothetical protein